MASSLFQQLIAASGLSPIFARTTMKRACERSGVAAEHLTRDDLIKALPSIRQALETYLAPHMVEDRIRAIRRLHGSQSFLTVADRRANQDVR
jgi:hypothetical protein